jgi:transcriptional regulator with XRE-family HTH domain
MATVSELSDRHLTEVDAPYERVAERHVAASEDAPATETSPPTQTVVGGTHTSRTLHQMRIYEDPAAARRRLQRELRKLRADANLTQRDVADAMEWSPSKVIRIEAGGVSITTNDLKQLLAYYGLTDQAKVDNLLATNRDSRKQSWSDFKDVLEPVGRTYWGYEASAVILRQYEYSLIPGLLQTEEYTRAVLSGVNRPRPSDERIDRLVEARAARQTLLDREVIPELFFVLDESVLRREIGGQTVMRRQLERIEELGARERISIQVVPMTYGAYPGQLGSFVVLEFQDEDTVLFLEGRGLSGSITRDDPEDVGQFLDVFQEMEKEVASKPAALNSVLSKIKNDMSRETE